MKVLAAERGRDVVGVQARGVDHGAGEDRLARGPDRQAAGTGDAGVDAGQQRHRARRGHPRQGAHVRLRLDDAARRRPDGRRRLDVRLAPAHEGAVDHLEVGDPVGVSPRRERFERADLVGPGGDDQLAGPRAPHAVLLAEGVGTARHGWRATVGAAADPRTRARHGGRSSVSGLPGCAAGTAVAALRTCMPRAAPRPRRPSSGPVLRNRRSAASPARPALSPSRR